MALILVLPQALSQTVLLPDALTVGHSIDLNGYNLTADSFDSRDLWHSWFGQYQASTAKDHGDVAINGSLSNSLGIGDAHIYGYAKVSSGGSVAVGPSGGVGERTWQAAHPGQIEPGWLRATASFFLPEIDLPYTNGLPIGGPMTFVTTSYVVTSTNITTTNYPAAPPYSGVTTNVVSTNTVVSYPGPLWGITTNWTQTRSHYYPGPGTYLDPPGVTNLGSWYYYFGIGSYSYPALSYTYAVYSTNAVSLSNTYDHVIPTGGDYYVDSLSGSTLVLASNARLVIASGLHMGGNDLFVVAPGAGVQVYSGGTSCTVGGNGMINQSGRASALNLCCASSVTSIAFNGNGSFLGTLCAPGAHVRLNGSGSVANDFIGALAADSVTLNGHYSFHYDEALSLYLWPWIYAQPQSQMVPCGASVTFSVSATFSYSSCQWLFNGNAIPGATSNVLTLAHVGAPDAGTYSVLLYDYLFMPMPSSNAVLTVTGDPPSILAQPVSQAAVPGSNVLLCVLAVGSAPLAYQWKLNGTDIAEATNSLLALSAVQPGDIGTYSVVVTNGFGSVTSSDAGLSLTAAPDFLWARGASNGPSGLSSGGSPAWSTASGLAVDAAGNVFVAGASDAIILDLGGAVLTNSVPTNAASPTTMQFICKYDAGGNVHWTRPAGTNGYSPTLPLRIGTDASGNAYLAGHFQGTAGFGSNTLVSVGPADMFVAKYSLQGQVAWARRIGAFDSSYWQLFGLAVDPAGNAYLASRDSGTADFGAVVLTNSASFLAKYDPAGTLVWATEALAADACAPGTNGAVYLTGHQGILAKYDALGALAWSRTFPSGQAIALDAQENVFVTGYGLGTYDGLTITNSGGSGDLFVARCNPSGQLLWLRQAGGLQQERGRGIALDSFDNVYVAGSSATASFEPSLAFGPTLLTNVMTFLAEYDSAGNALGAAAPTTTNRVTFMGVAAIDPADVYVAGNFSGVSGSFSGDASSVSFGSFTLQNPGSSQSEIFLAKLAGVEPPVSPAARLTSPLSFSNGQFQFTISGLTNQIYVVESSTNLLDWLPLTTNTPPFTFIDQTAPTSTQRFYRAVFHP